MAKTAKRARVHLGYVRVSTEDQATNGLSLDTQEARLRAYAFAQGRELAEVAIDAGVSAATLQRPGIARIMERITRGEVESLSIVKLDRLTRSLRDLSALVELCNKKGTALVSVSETLDTSTSTGRMMVNLLGTFAQFERERTSERTVEVVEHKRRIGLAYGFTPYGYRREGERKGARLVEVPEHQAAIALMRSLQAEGSSLRGIAKALTDAGHAPPSGKAWYASSVRAVLHSLQQRVTRPAGRTAP